MMTLYTAIGAYKLNPHGLPTVVAGGREYGMTTHELILWSSLAFRILTYRELRAEFYQKEKDLRILGELEFDHYLNRLKMRGLIVSGRDDTGVDALYDLMGHLHVQAVPSGIMVKTLTFLKLWLYRKLPVNKAALSFYSEKLEPMEKRVMTLIKHQTLSTAELVLCLEHGKKTLKNSAELMDCLYVDEDADCDSIVTDGRISESRYPVLAAVANLYLKQRVTFQIV